MTVTGIEVEERAAVFVVCIFHDRSITAKTCCTLYLEVHLTEPSVAWTMLGSVLAHLTVARMSETVSELIYQSQCRKLERDFFFIYCVKTSLMLSCPCNCVGRNRRSKV